MRCADLCSLGSQGQGLRMNDPRFSTEAFDHLAAVRQRPMHLESAVSSSKCCKAELLKMTRQLNFIHSAPRRIKLAHVFRRNLFGSFGFPPLVFDLAWPNNRFMPLPRHFCKNIKSTSTRYSTSAALPALHTQTCSNMHQKCVPGSSSVVHPGLPKN